MTPHPIEPFGKYFCAAFSVCEFSKIFNRHNQTGALPSSAKKKIINKTNENNNDETTLVLCSAGLYILCI